MEDKDKEYLYAEFQLEDAEIADIKDKADKVKFQVMRGRLFVFTFSVLVLASMISYGFISFVSATTFLVMNVVLLIVAALYIKRHLKEMNYWIKIHNNRWNEFLERNNN